MSNTLQEAQAHTCSKKRKRKGFAVYDMNFSPIKKKKFQNQNFSNDQIQSRLKMKTCIFRMSLHIQKANTALRLSFIVIYQVFIKYTF